MELGEVRESGTAREIAIILQTYDTLVPDGAGSYLAAPISTGRRYFDALVHHKVKTLPELIGHIGEEAYLRKVRWPNVLDGERLADQLRRAGVQYLINTGPIMVQGWVGRDYMDLCYALIKRKVQTVYFHPEWAYSAGAVKEFLFCARLGVPCLTAENKPLTFDDARSALELVREHVNALALPLDGVEARLCELNALMAQHVKAALESRSGQDSPSLSFSC